MAGGRPRGRPSPRSRDGDVVGVRDGRARRRTASRRRRGRAALVGRATPAAEFPAVVTRARGGRRDPLPDSRDAAPATTSRPDRRGRCARRARRVAACGDDDAAANRPLSPAAAEGRQIARRAGCAACHGADGEGGTGPAWAGAPRHRGRARPTARRSPSTRPTSARSIADPGAQVHDGFAVRCRRTSSPTTRSPTSSPTSSSSTRRDRVDPGRSPSSSPPLLLAVGAPSGTVAADPAGPTDFRTTVESVTPPTEGIDVDVIGGDSFLQLTVAPGVDVVVLGYQQEPYLHFRRRRRRRGEPAVAGDVPQRRPLRRRRGPGGRRPGAAPNWRAGRFAAAGTRGTTTGPTGWAANPPATGVPGERSSRRPSPGRRRRGGRGRRADDVAAGAVAGAARGRRRRRAGARAADWSWCAAAWLGAARRRRRGGRDRVVAVPLAAAGDRPAARVVVAAGRRHRLRRCSPSLLGWRLVSYALVLLAALQVAVWVFVCAATARSGRSSRPTRRSGSIAA